MTSLVAADGRAYFANGNAVGEAGLSRMIAACDMKEALRPQS